MKKIIETAVIDGVRSAYGKYLACEVSTYVFIILSCVMGLVDNTHSMLSPTSPSFAEL